MVSLFKRVSLFRLIVLFVFPLCLITSLHAQSLTGTIEGTVTDVQGASIPKSTVAVKNTDTGIIRTIVTDSAGRYQVGSLIPGIYEITVESRRIQEFETYRH